MQGRGLAILGCVAALAALCLFVYAGLAYTNAAYAKPCIANTGLEFDAILYINLANRADRLADIRKVLRTVNWLAGSSRIDAVRDTTNGAVGCLKSHIKALETFLAMPDNVRHALILEDDCEFIVDPRPGVDLFLAAHGDSDWDVLMLSSSTLKEEPYTSYATRIQNAQTTAAYAVTRRFAAILLAHWQASLTQPFLECDQSWKTLQAGSRWFCLLPKPGRQRESYSDIEKRSVNYGV
jgi:hypothetical protein